MNLKISVYICSCSFKTILLVRKLWTPMILNRYLLLTRHDKWLVKNSWKTLQTSRRGRHSSIKMLHSRKLLSAIFWNWKQCTAILKRIRVTWDCNALSVTETFCWFNKQVQNLKIVYRNVSSLCHSCYTQTPWVMFPVLCGGYTR